MVGDLVLAQILVSDEGVPSVGSACLERGDDGIVDSGGGGAGAGHSEPNLAARVGAASTILVIAVRRHAAPRASDEQRRNKQRHSHREKQKDRENTQTTDEDYSSSTSAVVQKFR